MAKPFFRYVPDFDYVSRLQGAKRIGDYVRVKNLFKRLQVRPDIFNDASYFTKYTIIGDERPDNVAFKVYNDSNFDWLIMMSNNIVNLETEWPLTQQSFYNYLISKYGDEEKIYSSHHYESKEVKNSQGRVILPKGLEVPQDYSITFYDPGTNTERTVTQITDEVTNYIYEERLQNKRRNIYILKDQYISLVLDDMDNLLPYESGSSQYVSSKVVRGDNIRLY